LERFLPDNWELTLIYIESDKNEANSQIKSLLSEILGRKIKALSIKGKLFDDFEKFHFTNSILYKLILPEIIQSDYILNLDAGFLSGPNIHALFEYCEAIVNSGEFVDTPIAAVCGKPEDANCLSTELRQYGHNNLYPYGWLFFINREAYRKNNFYSKIINGYNFFKDKLVWAEQDLLCLIAKDNEIINLNLTEQILIEQLSVQSYILDEASKAWVTKFMLYKITGTLKPWKLWVFDRKKQFYLTRRHELSGKVNWEGCQVVQENWYKINHQQLFHAFLAAHEKK
jgi:lipopolysaccharide biosynthesis glycosyltransferase